MFERYLGERGSVFRVVGVCVAQSTQDENGQSQLSLECKVGTFEKPINLMDLLYVKSDTYLQ